MLRIGLTGGIGSGKSTVARRLAERGLAVVDADQLARRAVAPGSPGLARVVEAFGPEILSPDGDLDRRALGRVVFEQPERRAALEAIVHPEVARLAAEASEQARAAGARAFVYDVPLLYENGLEEQFERVVVVGASLPTRRARIAARDGLSEAEIEARIASQMPLETKLERADHVIDNDGALDATLRAVDRLIEQLLPSTDETP